MNYNNIILLTISDGLTSSSFSPQNRIREAENYFVLVYSSVSFVLAESEKTVDLLIFSLSQRTDLRRCDRITRPQSKQPYRSKSLLHKEEIHFLGHADTVLRQSQPNYPIGLGHLLH